MNCWKSIWPEQYTADRLEAAIQPELPPGMHVGVIDVLPAPDRKAQVKFVTFEMGVPAPRQTALDARIEWLLGQSSIPIQREGRKTSLDLRPLIAELVLRRVDEQDGILRMRLRVDREGSARPREVLQALEIEDLENEGFFLTRTRVEVE